MRNSSLVEWSCAENITGLSIQPKLGMFYNMVGERRIRGEVRAGALVDCIRVRMYSSENAGMSSENYVGIIMAENLRFPGEGSSAQG